MAGMEWLGTVEKGETDISALAKALQGGISGYFKGREWKEKTEEKTEDKRRWEEEMDLKRGELKYKLANLSQSNLMDVVNTMNRILGFVDKDKRAEMLNDPEIQAVFDAAGVPIPRDEVEESPWAGTSWLDRTKAAVTPWATEMEKERGGLRPGGVFAPPTTRTRPPTPRSKLLPSIVKEGGLPEGVTEEDVQFTMKKHKLTRQQVLERMRR